MKRLLIEYINDQAIIISLAPSLSSHRASDEQQYNFGSCQGRAAVIDDTVCLSLNHLQGKLKVSDPDIGKLSGRVSLGPYYHVGLAYDLDCTPFGLSYLEADSYEYFDSCEQLGLDFIVRCQHNRGLPAKD